MVGFEIFAMMRQFGCAHRKEREERKARQQFFRKNNELNTNLYELGGAMLGHGAELLGGKLVVGDNMLVEA